MGQGGETWPGQQEAPITPPPGWGAWGRRGLQGAGEAKGHEGPLCPQQLLSFLDPKLPEP